MGVIDSMLSLFGGKVTETGDAGWFPVSAGGGRLTLSGQFVSSESAMALSAYYACLRNISEDLAKLPINVFLLNADDTKTPQPDHPVRRLLHTCPSGPNGDPMTAMTFRETLTHHALGWGNGYAEIERNSSSDPVALHPIHPSRVEVRRDADGLLFYVVHGHDPLGQSKARMVSIAAGDMLHIRGLGGDGLVGYSVLRHASETLGLGLAAQTFGASFFRHGAAVGGVLEHPTELSDEAYKRLRSEWNSEHGGAENGAKVYIAEEGMKYSRRSIPPNEAQFLESRQFQVEEIARWFRVPPHKIQHLLRSTNNNIEHQSIEYTGDSVQPWGTRWEQEANLKLLDGNASRRSRAGTLFTKHNYDALLQTDQKAQAAWFRGMFSIGFYTINEMRRIKDLNPIGPEGDVRYVPLNMARAEDAAAGASAKQNPNRNPTDVDPDQGQNQREDERDRRGADTEMIKTAFMPVFVDIADRLLCREVKAVRSKKFANRSAFESWLEKFYSGHRQAVKDAFRPAIESMSRVQGVPTKGLVGFWTDRYVDHSKKMMREAYSNGRVSADALSPFFTDLPAQIAKTLTDEVCSHA